jgi:asparagine synthase (glutamine-hydrolysing)
MSGFCGIWHPDGRPVDGQILARMSATLAHRGPDGEGMRLAGPLGLAHRLLRITPESQAEVQPLSDGAGRSLVFNGRLDERSELLRHLNETPPGQDRDPLPSTDAPDPDLVLAWLARKGESGLATLQGDFALAFHDPAAGALTLARDPMGTRPLYWWVRGSTVLFATEIKALLAHPKVPARPDEEYLAVRLLARNRENTCDRTYYAGVHSLEPGRRVRFSGGGHEEATFWDFALDRPLRLEDPREYTHLFRDLLDQAVRRRLRCSNPVVVSVSGGLDSSTIFGLAESARREEPGGLPKVLGITYAPPPGTPADEITYIEALEAHWEARVRRIPVGAGGPLAGATELVRQVEAPFLDEHAPTMRAFYGAVTESGARVVLSGHWADQFLFDTAYLVDLARRLRWGTVARHMREFPRWFPGSDIHWFRRRYRTELVKFLLPGAVVARLRSGRIRTERTWLSPRLVEAARRSRLNQGLRPRTGSAHARSLYEQARSGHHGLCLEWDDKAAGVHGLEVAFPFFDRDLIDFILRVPGEVLHPGGVPKGLLRQAMEGVLPEKIRQRDWKADFTAIVNAGVRSDLPAIRELLGPGARVREHGFVTSGGLDRWLSGVEAGLGTATHDTAWELLDLTGLELWLRNL